MWRQVTAVHQESKGERGRGKGEGRTPDTSGKVVKVVKAEDHERRRRQASNSSPSRDGHVLNSKQHVAGDEQEGG